MAIPQLAPYRVTFSRSDFPAVQVWVWAVNRDFAEWNAWRVLREDPRGKTVTNLKSIWRVPSPKLARSFRLETNASYRARQSAAIRERAEQAKLAQPETTIVALS
jgi:hypothetical protein